MLNYQVSLAYATYFGVQFYRGNTHVKNKVLSALAVPMGATSAVQCDIVGSGRERLVDSELVRCRDGSDSIFVVDDPVESGRAILGGAVW